MGITVKIMVATDEELRACETDRELIHKIFHSTREEQYVHEARAYAAKLRRAADAGELKRISANPTYIIESSELAWEAKMKRYVPDKILAIARANNQGLLLHEFEDY